MFLSFTYWRTDVQNSAWCENDASGELTFVTAHGNSVIDYYVVSEYLLSICD